MNYLLLFSEIFVKLRPSEYNMDSFAVLPEKSGTITVHLGETHILLKNA